jgi:hypothetical protein
MGCNARKTNKQTNMHAGLLGCYKREREKNSLELENPKRELRTQTNA